MKTVRYVWFLLIFSLFWGSSCSAELDWEYINPVVADSDVVSDKRELHILVIGDSFSRDAFSYAPSVINNLCPNVIIDMEILYLGGRALNYHWNYLISNTENFTIDSYTTVKGRWSSSFYQSGEKLIRSQKWDVVILQEGSVTVRNYEKTLTNVQNLKKFIQSLQEGVKFAFMMSPAKPDGTPALGSYSSEEVWRINASTANMLLEEGEVDFVIPCGTAIQNARQTMLDKYGDFGHLSYDGNHLQEGLPCLIEAYTAAQELFMFFNIDTSIEKSNLKITQEWVNAKNIPGQHGKVIEGTEDDYENCKKSSLLAVGYPYYLSNP